MPKKKKGKDDAPAVEEKAPPPVIREPMIRIEFKLLNWKFMNFSMLFKKDTYVSTLKRILHEKHGKITDLKICFNAFTESNEVTDEMLTLRECGLQGFPVTVGGGPISEEEKELEERSIPIVQLFYDYKPANEPDPVILFFR
jgi:hypothetical protein